MTDTDNRERQRQRLIVALDLPARDQALAMARRLAPYAATFKLGLELFTRCGPGVVADLKELGCGVFLDLKFHDIPNTVAAAVRAACALDADFLTLHLAGGQRMTEAAAAAAAGSRTTLLGVTVLTSSDLATLAATGVAAKAVEDQVLRLARLGFEGGVHGLVASPLEASLLRQVFGSDFPLVTPGVRPQGAAAADQHRVATPATAIANGATHVVVGRPLTCADDPVAAARNLLDSLAQAG